VSTDLWLAEDGVAAKFASASGATPDEIVATVSAGAPTGRFTTPREVADLTVFLASSRSANTTGADVRIDGGYVTTV
jgi:NAD(P)-dependent dehydrogenase (short-subunit alcohol dehydrogenase family)